MFVVIWSTGFIGAKYGLPYAGPFIYLALRMVLACTLMIALARFTRGAWPRSLMEARHYAISGLLLHAGYLGGVFFAISRGMSAGLSALVVGLQPILVAVIAQRTLGERVTIRQWGGLILGFAGVGIVVFERMRSNGGLHGSTTLAADIAIVVALLSTTLGTIYQKRFGNQMPLASGTAIQYGTTAIVMIVLALLFEPLTIDWSPRFVAALAWQVLVLSLLAVTLLMVLIRQHSVSRLTSYLYLVPPLTAIEAYLIFGEKITLAMVLGVAVV
ncbi:MAG TPA: DMT family transporter, partial [Thermomicrobiales bacterium]|nr:DMT family transporter [Thermomicrobiales bacterium]